MADALTRDDLVAAFAAAVGAKDAVRPDPRKVPDEKTGVQTHRANQRGYDSQAGVFYEDGEVIGPGVTVSDVWMDEIPKKGRALAGAVQEAQDQAPKDVDLTQVGLPGLRAMAAERGINPKGLSEADLITAIKAEREPTI